MRILPWIIQSLPFAVLLCSLIVHNQPYFPINATKCICQYNIGVVREFYLVYSLLVSKVFEAAVATMENSMEVFQKLKLSSPYELAIPLLGIYPEKILIGKGA